MKYEFLRTLRKNYLVKQHKVNVSRVDDNWINNENPSPKATSITEHNHSQAPIDKINADSRVLNPILSVKLRIYFLVVIF